MLPNVEGFGDMAVSLPQIFFLFSSSKWSDWCILVAIFQFG